MEPPKRARSLWTTVGICVAVAVAVAALWLHAREAAEKLPPLPQLTRWKVVGATVELPRWRLVTDRSAAGLSVK